MKLTKKLVKEIKKHVENKYGFIPYVVDQTIQTSYKQYKSVEIKYTAQGDCKKDSSIVCSENFTGCTYYTKTDKINGIKVDITGVLQQ